MVMNPEKLRQAGDWMVQLKTILGQGFKGDRKVDQRPESKHRTTKKAVKLLLSNLREGVKETDHDTTDEDINRVVFNAVEQLIDDKVDKTEKGKTTLEALTKFATELEQQFAAQSKKKGALDEAWKGRIMQAVRALKAEEWLALPPQTQQDIVLNDVGSEDSVKYREEMLQSEEGKRALGKMLNSIDPDLLEDFDFRAVFGTAKNTVLSEALVASLPDLKENPDAKLDPELFAVLAKNVPLRVWNDKSERQGARKGLGPRVCAGLWETGNYDQICELIEQGVDTTLAANVGVRVMGPGIYSGFIQPLQHVLQSHLRDIDRLENEDTTTWDPKRKSKAEGAKKIMEALEKAGKAVTLTSWKDVEDSEMIEEFKKNPGTIWGFENIRMPYVESAHGTEHGAQPLRMMEIWRAVEQSLDFGGFSKLLADPDKAADKFVEYGVAITNIPPGVDKVKFKENFRRDAKAFLLEFAGQMPKGTFIRPTFDDEGDDRKEPLSQVAGIVQGKFMGGLACKAGLWWAKQEKKPVYYCLDGINMDDVTNYKRVKNKAIEKYISGGGTGHEEVITLVEMREILKNWDELKDTVKFVLKGKILTGDDLEEQVAAWQQRMQEVKEEVGRTPAPPRANFANELKAIDPGLMARFPEGPEGDMDARDVVKKFGYLTKVAKARPHIVLKYIISKCTILIKYELIARKLPSAAAAFGKAEGKEIAAKRRNLIRQIENCHENFQEPLKTALFGPR